MARKLVFDWLIFDRNRAPRILGFLRMVFSFSLHLSLWGGEHMNPIDIDLRH